MSSGKCRRAILIGLDGLIPDFAERFAGEGVCPNLKKLMAQGCMAENWPAPDTLTPTNWVSLSTGAWPGTHQITSFSLHYEGTPFDEIYSNQAIMFPVRPRVKEDLRIKAEFIWDAAAREGLRCITANYPGAYPASNPDLVAVDGEGGGVFSGLCCVRPVQLYVVGKRLAQQAKSAERHDMVANPFSTDHDIPIALRTADGSAGVPASRLPVLDSVILEAGETAMELHGGSYVPVGEADRQFRTDRRLRLYVYATEQGYDRVRISDDGSPETCLADLAVGERSDWLHTRGTALFAGECAPNDWGVAIDREMKLNARYRFELEELSPDAKELVLKRTNMFNSWGWSQPAELADRLIDLMDEHKGEIEEALHDRCQRPSPFSQVVTPTSVGTYCTALTSKVLSDTYPDWRLMYVQIHSPDGMNHNEIPNVIAGANGYDPETAEEHWSHFREEYHTLDNMVGELMEAFDDGETAIIVVSDHGAVAASYSVWAGKFLEDAGLTVYKDLPDGKQIVDFEKSKAVPGDFPLTPCVWVNLKGRDPQGVVEREDYESVREEIIGALTAARCPFTGRTPYAVVARTEELACMGQWGPTQGDVVLLTRGEYENTGAGAVCTVGPIDRDKLDPWRKTGFQEYSYGQHLGYYPNARTGEATVAGTFLAAGPGIRKGYRRKAPIWTVDVVPTICYLLGIKPPAQCEGKVPLDMLL